MKKNLIYFQYSFVLWVCIFVFFAHPTISFGSCTSEAVLLNYQYTGACGYTQSTSFTLDKDTNITRIRIWYDTSIGGNSISATLSGPNGYTSASGTISQGGGQWSWAEAIWNINQVLQSGIYTLTANSKSMCSNPSGQTTLILYGCTTETTSPTVSDFKSIGAVVTSFQFFESGGDAPPVNERAFAPSFSRTSARYIFYQLSLSHPAVSERVDFTLNAKLFRSDGALYAETEQPISILPEWSTSWHVQGWGWENAGNWPIDTYTVKIFDGSDVITTGTFSIVDEVQVEGIDRPIGVIDINATDNPTSAPVYMGNVITGGTQMALSVHFSAYNKPVDIFIAIGLPDGRYYVADEAGRVLNLESVGFLPIATGVSGTKTIKQILTPFEIGSSGTAFDPWPVDGTWIVYWLISPDCNGDIWKAVENKNYELGYYTFQVKSKSDVPPSTATTSTIAQDGGTIQTGTIKIQIPSGAVTEPVTINVTPVQPDMSFTPDADVLSDAYTIEVHGDLQLPITVTLSPKTVESDTVVAAMVDNLFQDIYSKTPEQGIHFLDVSLIDNHYTVTIPANSNTSRSAQEKSIETKQNGASTRSFTIWILGGYAMRTSTHFNIRYSAKSCNSVVMDEWLQYAEEAYSRLVNTMKFDPSGLAMPATRLTMDVVEMGPAEWGGLSYHTWTLGILDNLVLEFTLPARICNTITDDQRREMEVTIGHEFFHAIQNTYEPAHALVEAIWGTRGLCLFDASSTWFEAEMLEDRGYIGAPAREQVFSGNAFYTRGLGYGCASDPQNYGYGASTFLRYLTEKYGIDIILVMWRNIRSGAGFHVPIDAMMSAGIKVVDEWENFSKALLLGTTGFGWPIPAPDGTLVYQNTSTPLKINESMYQISSKKYKIDFLSLIDTATNPRCRIRLNEGLGTYSVNLYHLTTQVAGIDQEFTPIASDKYSLIVTNIQDTSFTDNGIRYGRQTPVKICIECGPVIESVSQAQDASGNTSVTLNGFGYGTTADTRYVYFNDTVQAASVTWVSETQAIAVVPANTTLSTVVVEVNGMRSNVMSMCRYQEVTGSNGSIMKDTVTGFEWQRCSVGQTWNSTQKTCNGTATLFNARDAFNLTMDGGWRTPTAYELESLVYCGDDSFPVNPSWFWTSSWWETCVGDQCDSCPIARNYEKEAFCIDPDKNLLAVRMVRNVQ
ncbi:MAG: IPT/TIG domain-containing protein [Desulfobacterales bacterium]|nr:IPT/TIG domain-containing protein [Desulfobacterales bacterium]